MAGDFVVSFRFPFDDFFVRHETNVYAANKREAMKIIKAHIQDAEDVTAERGIVMLYGERYNTIKTDVRRSEQMEEVSYGK